MTADKTKSFLESLGPIGNQIKLCTRCGFCNAVCPTSNISGAYKESKTSRGRLMMLQSMLYKTGELSPIDKRVKRLMDLCYSCRRCITICPAGIQIPDLLTQVRSYYVKERRLTALNLGHYIYGNYELFDHLGSLFSPLSNWVLKRSLLRRLIEYVTHIDRRANLPLFYRNTFKKWFVNRKGLKGRKTIAYFIDSFANYNRPELGKAVVKIAESYGYRVVLPRQTDSGMPSIDFGMYENALSKAQFNLKHLYPYARRGIEILCSSPAASFLLKEGYPNLLGNRKAKAVSKMTIDIAEFIHRGVEEGNLELKKVKGGGEVLYHYGCLSQALKKGKFTEKTLNRCGYNVKVIDNCCGSAGVWTTFKENFDLGAEIGEELFQHISCYKLALTESETCKMHIDLHTGRDVAFPTEIIANHLET